jgi:hypothetical protein
MVMSKLIVKLSLAHAKLLKHLYLPCSAEERLSYPKTGEHIALKRFFRFGHVF